MTEPIVTTWLLTYAVHGALFAALAAVAERTRWGALASRRDAFWKLALVGGIVTSTVFVAAGSAPSGAAIRVPAGAVFASQAEPGAGIPWVAMTWIAVTAALALRAVRGWRAGVSRAGRRRVIRRGDARAALDAILGPAAGRVDLTCSRTLGVPVAFRREICVPIRALRELPHDELRALLAHEAAHVLRRDAAWLMIAAAIRALGWWQPLNLVAAARLRLAMELCCDERAAAEPRDRAALARCLVKVAAWNVRPLNRDGAVLATMASRGSALRRRLESLLDDAPRRRGIHPLAPWLAVTTIALPIACLAPVVTIASLSGVPAAAVRLVRHAPASDTAGVRAVPVPVSADSRAATRSSKTTATGSLPAEARSANAGPLPAEARSATAGPLPAEARRAKAGPIAAASDGTAVTGIAPDQLSATTPQPPPVRPSPEPVPIPSASSTRLRDAIAAARIPPEPPSRTRLDLAEPERRGLSRIARYVGFDTTRPKIDAPAPEQRGRNWTAQHNTRIPNP